MRTLVYIDGYNLFYGCLKHSGDKWLDIHRLFKDFILRTQCPKAVLVQVKFFTADIKGRVATRGDAAIKAQSDYHRALERLYPEDVSIIKGYYSLEKAYLPAYRKPPDKSERLAVWKLEEKQTDINIALTAYRDVAAGRVDQLVFVTNDTDLAPALKAIREDFGNKTQIGIVIPVRKTAAGQKKRRPPNNHLSQYADWTRKHINDEELAKSALPSRIATGKKPIRKPEYW